MLIGHEAFWPLAGPSGDLLRPKWETLRDGSGNLWPPEVQIAADVYSAHCVGGMKMIRCAAIGRLLCCEAVPIKKKRPCPWTHSQWLHLCSCTACPMLHSQAACDTGLDLGKCHQGLLFCPAIAGVVPHLLSMTIPWSANLALREFRCFMTFSLEPGAVSPTVQVLPTQQMFLWCIQQPPNTCDRLHKLMEQQQPQ
jgi:hypothetical protein